MRTKGLALLAAIAALGAGSAFGASQAAQPDAATASAQDRAVVRELRSLRRQLRATTTTISRDLRANGSSIVQVRDAIGQFSYQSGTVRGLLKAICDQNREPGRTC